LGRGPDAGDHRDLPPDIPNSTPRSGNGDPPAGRSPDQCVRRFRRAWTQGNFGGVARAEIIQQILVKVNGEVFAKTDLDPGNPKDFWKAMINTKGASHLYVLQNTVVPGGTFGKTLD
jgi:hypothetical protein